MVKYLLNFLFVFLMLSSFSFAQKDDAKLQVKLQKEFGYDLTHVPFFLRFSYYKKFDKNWKESDYPERLAFLKNYETNLAAEQVKEKADAKAAAAKEKERLGEKKEALRKEKERSKARLAEEKAEKKAEEGRQKEFNASVSEQKKELQQMTRRRAAQGSVPGSSQESSQESSQGSY